jgi:hypothetical protein
MNAGYFYCPYVDLDVTPTVLERDDEADAIAAAMAAERFMHMDEEEEGRLDLWNDPESVLYIGPDPADFNWLLEGF